MLWFKCSQLPDICNLWRGVVSSFRHCLVAKIGNHFFTPSIVINCRPLCLSDRIAQNRKTIVCPMIDVIDHDNFGYETQAGDAMRGAFDWEMYYKRIPIPQELQKDDPSEPFEWVQSFLTHLAFAIRMIFLCHECMHLWHRWSQCELKTFNWVCYCVVLHRILSLQCVVFWTYMLQGWVPN